MIPAYALRLITEAALTLLARELARRLPQPPAPPRLTPEQRATMLASDLAARLWDRYRDPSGNRHHGTPHGRKMALLYAAVLDEETVAWLARQIQAEHAEGDDAPPLSHHVHL